MAGKLKIDMTYNPELGNNKQLWGDFTITYNLNGKSEELHYTKAPLDKFIKWYIISSPYIFANLTIPLIENESYAECLRKYLDNFDGEKRLRIFNEATKFHNIHNAFIHPSEPDIFLIKRGEYGEISLFQGMKTYAEPIPRFKTGTWLYLFNLQNFVQETKKTIFSFLDDVKTKDAGKDSKYVDAIVKMTIALNTLPKID